MRYTKEKSLKSRRPNEKASEMKGRIARGLLSVALVGVLTTIMPFNANANSSNVYYLGEAVNAGKDTGFSENNEITKKDPHYNWTLGSFSVNGYTRVITDDGNPILNFSLSYTSCLFSPSLLFRIFKPLLVGHKSFCSLLLR